MDQDTEVERDNAKSVDSFLAPLAMQVLECQGTVGGYVQPLVFLVDPEADLIDMKRRACQKVFLGGFTWFKRIIKPTDVAKTGGLGQLDVRHGLHQFNTSAQRQHMGDQKVARQCLNPKFSSWSVIPADSSRCFHAISARCMSVVQLIRFTKWVSDS